MSAEPTRPVGATDPLGAVARRVLRLQKEFFGKGPARATVHRSDEAVIILLRDIYTPAEHRLIDAGLEDEVTRHRRETHRVTNDDYKQVVEEELGVKVAAVVTANQANPDLAVKVFILE